MESVDRLRAYVHLHKIQTVGSDCMDTATSASALVRLADAIEAEVAEGYAPLPIGKDGRPIRPGDTVYGSDGHEWQVTYIRIGRNHSIRATDGTESRAMRPEWLTHEKPPTVEDVLEKALNEAAMLDRDEGYWPSAADVTNIVNEYAAKLRLAGGDE